MLNYVTVIRSCCKSTLVILPKVNRHLKLNGTIYDVTIPQLLILIPIILRRVTTTVSLPRAFPAEKLGMHVPEVESLIFNLCYRTLGKFIKSLSFSFPIHQAEIIIKPILKGCGKTKYKKNILLMCTCHIVSTQYVIVVINTTIVVDVISASFVGPLM